MTAWKVMVNARAGDRRRLEDRARDALTAFGLESDAESPDGIEAMREQTLSAAAAGWTRFAVVGGDGTLNVVVDALMQRTWSAPPVVGLLPSGTGSDFARTFALPQRLEEAAAHLVGERTYPVDVGIAEGSWGKRAFINEVQAGLGAATAGIAERLPRRIGAAKYQIAFWATLPRFRPAMVKIEAGLRSFEGPALAVVAANGQFFGGGLNIAPRASLRDGKLDVQAFSVLRRSAVPLFRKIKVGMHGNHPGVHRMPAASVSIETEIPWPVEVDGEPLGMTPLKAYMVPNAIEFKI
ncbi:MAG: YegS/Rv2252/BmrU family lipid kinase [Acidimicrobiia bacterium]|nr:YegS/Rv2252/BmrU family lipid kinase [Acidimicrobiia bacterium]